MSVAGALIGGLYGASVSGGSILTGATVAGTLIGSEIGRKAEAALTPEPPTVTAPSAIITSAGYAGEAEKQRRRRRKGYGTTILAGGELGAATTRKEILGG